MIVAYWIAAGLLSLVTLYASGLKLFRSKDQLAAGGMAWTAGYSPAVIKLIAAAEFLGVVGLIVPPLTGIATVLAPIAAIALVLLQVGATATHVRLGEQPVLNVVLIVLGTIAAVSGFIVWV